MKVIILKTEALEKKFTQNETITIGRSPKNAFQLQDQSVSGTHGEIVYDSGNFIYRDLKSMNGTIIQRGREQVLLSPETTLKYPLANGHEIICGRSTIEVYINEITDIKEIHTQTIDRIVDIDLQHGIDEKNFLGLHQHLLSLLFTNTIEDLFRQIAEAIFNTIPVGENLIIALRDRWEGFEPTFATSRHPSMEELTISQTIIRRVVGQKRSIVYRDEGEDFSTTESFLSTKIKTVCCVPLWNKEQEIVGVLQLDSRSSSAEFSQKDLNLMTIFGNSLAMAIEKTHLYENLLKVKKEEERLRKTFQKYVPSEVIRVNLEAGEGSLFAQKRLVTILFSDFRGFTRFSENKEPEKVVRILNDYFDNMVEIIEKHHGYLDKYMGDGLMVIFGAPESRISDAYNAVLTAVEMMKAMKNLNRKWRREGIEEIKLGIGIHTGEVIAGNIGTIKRMEYSAIGDTVNSASRIEGLTADYPNTILISEATYRAIKEVIGDLSEKDFRIEEWGTRKVKGKTRELVLYEVLVENKKGALR